MSDTEDLYFWRGVLVQPEWIMSPDSISPQDVLTEPNMERRRAGCEIFGWERILRELNAVTIDRDEDPMVGELVEVELPGLGKEKFLRVVCGTGRKFALAVPPNMRTALEANAWSFNIEPDVLKLLEVRT